MNLIIEKTSLKKAILFTLLFIVLLFLINYSAIGVAGLLQITDGANILDFEFGYTADRALEMLTALGEQGRAFYLVRILPVDFLFPLSYMLCYSSWIALLLKNMEHNNIKRFIILIPFLAMIFDWVENIGIIFMLINYPILPEWAIFTGSTAGILKMLSIRGCFAVIVVLLLIYIVKHLRNKFVLGR